ncbi:hypothetical protein BGZ67_000846 [Mortierella alpina]|nr:hypothetical protein BGZ67_000846 [Mortierella alpina]
MRLTTAILSVASAALLACSSAQAADPVVGGYVLIRPDEGQAKLKALADNAASIPINRLYLSFARPGMVYVPNSNTLEHVGLNYAKGGDYGFADLKENIHKLQSAGVEVFLSVGGWNYGCFPYAYTYYSVGGYGESTPNYYKIKEFGSVDACTEANMWCYTCEPKSENTVLADFDIFPEPEHSETWKQAQDYIVKLSTQAGKEKPVYHPDIIPGQEYNDPKHNLKVKVPGNNYFLTQKRDPYQDLVLLGRDLNLTGIDIDYEEMWHADMFKTVVGGATGPFLSHQTVYKYATIMKDVQINIQKLAPKLKLATAAAVTGGMEEAKQWWGGNLKNVWFNVNKFFPEVYKAISSSGGVNVMSYDVSSATGECPDGDESCDLNKQVDYYMTSFLHNNMDANVGYEIGIPAYPAPDHDPQHQLPLNQKELSAILQKYGSKGGFFWELYKAPGASGNVDATSAAQQICKAALGANTPRCSGVIPQPGDRPHTVTSAPVVKPTSAPVIKPTSVPVIKPTKTTTLSSSGPKPTTDAKCTAPAWTAGKKYVRDDRVQFKGREFQLQWDMNGASPAEGGGWKQVDICAAGGACAATDAWDESKVYNAGATALYQSYIYTAKWYAKGIKPDEAAGSPWTKGERCNAAKRR